MNDEALKRPLSPDWLNRSRRLINDAKVAGGTNPIHADGPSTKNAKFFTSPTETLHPVASNLACERMIRVLTSIKLLDFLHVSRLGDANALRAKSVELQRSIAKGTLKHQEAVNNSLRKRVAETRSLKQKLTLQTQAVTDEMTELELYKTKAEQMLEKTLKPMKLAEKRVRVRAQKPDGEKLYDNVERALQGECSSLQRSWESLSSKTQEAHAHWRKLYTQRQMLQDDLNDKAAALSVDESCMTMSLSASLDSTEHSNSGRPALNLSDPNHLTAKSQKPPERWKRDSMQLVCACLA